MAYPTLSQQRGIAFAPKPFAIISFLSSTYIIYYILVKDRQRLKRLYHRLILMMNIALLFISFWSIWGTWAIPEGTPYYVGARGTIATCTVQGFIGVMFDMTVPIYYASLVLQAYLGIKNNFKEERYRWIEKWIHILGWCFPIATATVLAATENLNPSASGCYLSKAPRGCEADPNVDCERGKDIGAFAIVVGLIQIFFYFIFPPVVIVAMYCWIHRIRKKMETCTGMHQVREAARAEMMRSIAKQVTLYLLAFWSTFILGMITNAYLLLSDGEILYNLKIVANCIYAFQGFIFMIVYFALERIGTPKVECLPHLQSERMTQGISMSGERMGKLVNGQHPTVKDIRSNAKRKTENGSEEVISSRRRSSLVFNIFDGTPDAESPWAQFIDQDSDDDEESDNDGIGESINEDVTVSD